MRLWWRTRGCLGTYDIGVEVAEVKGHPTPEQVLVTLRGQEHAVFLIRTDELVVQEPGKMRTFA